MFKLTTIFIFTRRMPPSKRDAARRQPCSWGPDTMAAARARSTPVYRPPSAPMESSPSARQITHCPQ